MSQTSAFGCLPNGSKRIFDSARVACRMIPGTVSKREMLELLKDEIGTIVPCVTPADVEIMNKNSKAAKNVSASVIRSLAAMANA